ncbi:MAG: N-6 DNA methylase [Bacteroidetes bacterium]|nr:N-6 DNA methylase [Bacteroidota bacterium]
MKDNFKDIMQEFQFVTDIRTAFDDFLTLTLCAFGQIPGAGKSYDEDLYLQTIGKYKKDKAQHLFPKLLACLTNEMTERIGSDTGWDVLGEFYEANCTLKGLSQFFTPWPICQFMARSSVETARESRKNEDKPLRILDPACGSGRTLMAASRVAGPTHEYYAIDIDHTCAKMTTLNLFLSGIFKSETMCANALLPEDFRVSYRASFVPFGVFRIQEKEKSSLWNNLKHLDEARKVPKQRPPDLNPNKYPEGSQMTFF